MAAGFIEPKTLSLMVDVDTTDSDTLIAGSSDTTDGVKTITFSGVKQGVNYSEAQTVFNKILAGIGGASYLSSTTKRAMTWTTGEKKSPELTVSIDDVELADGDSTEVTITRLGDGIINVLATQTVEGISYALNGTTLTFSNNGATSGTASYSVFVDETTEYSGAFQLINVTAVDE